MPGGIRASTQGSASISFRQGSTTSTAGRDLMDRR